MAFSSVDKSPLRQLVELNTSMAHSKEGEIATLHTTLQIRSDEVLVGDYTVAVEFKAAFLVVDAEGGSVNPENKWGMRVVSEAEEKATIERVVKAGRKQTKGSELGVEGSTGDLAATAAKVIAKRTRAKEQTRDETFSERVETTRKHIPVEAIGGDRWHIREKEGASLNAHFLTQSNRLCEIVKRPHLSNRFGAAVSVQVRRLDIEAKITSSRAIPFWDPNKDKILKMLAKQHLADLTQDGNRQIITFAHSEVYDEG